MERNTASSYVKQSSYKTHKPSVVNVYCCHRSGKYRCEGKGLRQLKTLGSNKIGFHCPALLRTETFENLTEGIKVTVEYQSTHVGHQCETERQRRPVIRVKDEITGEIKRLRRSTKVTMLQDEFHAELLGFLPKIYQCNSIGELRESIDTLKVLQEKIEMASSSRKQRLPEFSEIANELPSTQNAVMSIGMQEKTKKVRRKKPVIEEHISAVANINNFGFTLG